MGKIPVPWDKRYLVWRFLIIRIYLQWQELIGILSWVAWEGGTRLQGAWDFQLMICQAYIYHTCHQFNLNHFKMPMIGAMRAQSYQVPYFESLEVYKLTNLCFPLWRDLSFTLMLSLHLLALCTNRKSIVVILSALSQSLLLIDSYCVVTCALDYLLLVTNYLWRCPGIYVLPFHERLSDCHLCYADYMLRNKHVLKALLFMIFLFVYLLMP